MFKEAHEIATLLPSESEIEKTFDRLWPICRSLTGPGVRETLGVLSEIIPLKMESVESGTQVFDWTVPKEWSLDEAYLEFEDGSRILDFKNNNLHVVSYSTAIDTTVSLEDLQGHLHSLPQLPSAIPYVTSYYKEYWGFCLSHEQRQKLKPGKYRAVIRSHHKNGVLNYGHLVLPSTTGNKKEILFSTYVCHPSMANNELSGPLVTAYLYQALSKIKSRHYNYRFVFVPETIGAISYLAKYGQELKENCHSGLVVTCVGDDREVNYKKSKRGDAPVDLIAQNILCFEKSLKNIKIREFFPTGSDERQYCSPGFNLPVGSLIRSMYGEYPEYHTSLDNKDFISFRALKESLSLYLKIVMGLEGNVYLESLNPYCEPMLGKRGLYPSLGAQKEMQETTRLMSYLLSYADGNHNLVDIADKSKCSILDLLPLVSKLEEAQLVKRHMTAKKLW